MKRSLWFDASMLLLILIIATIGAVADHGSDRPASGSAQTASSTQPSASAAR